MITRLFSLLRFAQELKKIRLALERIATVQEELVLRDQSKFSGNALRTLYKDNKPEEGSILMQDDEDFATIERLEQAYERSGGRPPADDEELEDIR